MQGGEKTFPDFPLIKKQFSLTIRQIQRKVTNLRLKFALFEEDYYH